jgi:uncharacterized protein (DUF427 family)
MTVRLTDPFGRDLSDHWLQLEKSPKWLRVVLAGTTVAESKRTLLLREAGCLPVYYFPGDDLRFELFVPGKKSSACPFKGVASFWSLRIGERSAEDAAWSYADPNPECAGLKDHFAFEWNKMDHWYEEEEEIFVHPRDPYKRIDVIQSSRHVRVEAAGETVADSRRPTLLFETNHPVRYYLPMEDVRSPLLQPSPTKSRCPYKGIASYWSAKVGEQLLPDLAWSYLEPLPECYKIRGLICFFQERETKLYVDGEPLPKPKTKWAR